MKKRVQVKFCGGCNPHIERGEVYKKIVELAEEEDFLFTTDDGTGADIILIIDGCPTSCNIAEGLIDTKDKEVVWIAGESLDMEKVDHSDLAEIALKALISKL